LRTETRQNGAYKDNIICGRAGNDTIYGNDGNDILYGGRGNDRLYGGNEEDQLSGGPGTDHDFGQEGSDIGSGGEGDDTVQGNDGDDLIKSKDKVGGNDIGRRQQQRHVQDRRGRLRYFLRGYRDAAGLVSACASRLAAPRRQVLRYGVIENWAKCGTGTAP
jgi:hypothetical protein